MGLDSGLISPQKPRFCPSPNHLVAGFAPSKPKFPTVEVFFHVCPKSLDFNALNDFPVSGLWSPASLLGIFSKISQNFLAAAPSALFSDYETYESAKASCPLITPARSRHGPYRQPNTST